MAEPKTDEIFQFLIQPLTSEESGYQKLTHLINRTCFSNNIFRLNNLERIDFVPKKGFVKPVGNLKLERLTLVHPPSFEFTQQIELNGYFQIKYKSSTLGIPRKVEPFIANYTGVIILKENGFSIKNESVELPESLKLQ
ncbi:MAG: hypothetical protein JW731_14815 [Bacteroidales bacterium]|nr:hypothetical protein [Bacteroidales bacterium]